MKLAGVQAGRRSDSHSCGQKMKGSPDRRVPRRRKGGYFFSGSLTLLFHMCCHALIDRNPLAMRPYEMLLSVGDTQRSVAIGIIGASAVCVALLIALLVLYDMLVQHFRCDRCSWEKVCGLFACESLRDRMHMARRALRSRYQLSSDFPHLIASVPKRA